MGISDILEHIYAAFTPTYCDFFQLFPFLNKLSVCLFALLLIYFRFLSVLNIHIYPNDISYALKLIKQICCHIQCDFLQSL